MTPDVPVWLTGVLLAIVAAAAVSDVRSYTIPNAFPIVVAALFLLAIPLAGYGPAQIGWHVLSTVIGFGVGFGMFMFRLMGGGDVKLFAALALWTPPGIFATLAVAVAIAGGLLAGGVLAALWIRQRISQAAPDPDKAISKTRLPYGVAIFAGAAATALAVHV
ncbi:A24 family peptidase [Marinicauda salina]|uniref:A24 family peptidase n=1 Tax=Marinicauda salina TaxID=2135793 RepID=UPI001304DE86|nr:prepilin peptidase [Marinicauda salina]